MPTPLRLLRRAPRESVIVDMSAESPRFTSPLPHAEIRAMLDRPPAVPHEVFVGMWVAAWAQAEGCGLCVTSGRLEPSCRYEPSEQLWMATARSMGNLVGCLGFAIPVALDGHRCARAAIWPGTWGGN